MTSQSEEPASASLLAHIIPRMSQKSLTCSFSGGFVTNPPILQNSPRRNTSRQN